MKVYVSYRGYDSILLSAQGSFCEYKVAPRIKDYSSLMELFPSRTFYVQEISFSIFSFVLNIQQTSGFIRDA